jgi:hypothetical protein
VSIASLLPLRNPIGEINYKTSHGNRRGAEPSGTNRPSRPRRRANNLSSASRIGDNLRVCNTTDKRRVNWSSAKSATPPPLLPATSVASRKMIHQFLPCISSGIDTSNWSVSASVRGKYASSSNRSSLATNLAAHRQNFHSSS